MCRALICNLLFHFSIIWSAVLSSSVIPNGYYKEPGLKYYYKFHNINVTWLIARETCNKEKAHLAYIKTAKEEDMFLRKQKTAGDIWLGIHDRYLEGEWVSIYDEPIAWFDHMHWGKPEPNDHGVGEDCGSIKANGWNDRHCVNVKLPFFCMIPA